MIYTLTDDEIFEALRAKLYENVDYVFEVPAEDCDLKVVDGNGRRLNNYAITFSFERKPPKEQE